MVCVMVFYDIEYVSYVFAVRFSLTQSPISNNKSNNFICTRYLQGKKEKKITYIKN